MRVEVSLPSLGDEQDAATQATVSFWLAETGACVDAGDDLVEVTTDKAAFVVPSPVSGRVVEYYAAPGNIVPVGGRLCAMETVD